MNAEARHRRLEMRHETTKATIGAIRDIAVAAINQPVTGLILGVVANQAAYNAHLYDKDGDHATGSNIATAIGVVILTAEALKAFQPIKIGVSN